jgi:hypothetical protein
VHGLRQRATPVNAYRPDRCHLRRDPRLCGVAHLEIFRVAATGGEAVATDCLVNVEEEAPVELLGKPRTPECDRLNEQEANPARLRISTHLTNRLPYDRPLQLLKAHTNLDKIVLRIFGIKPDASESEILEALIAKYSEFTSEQRLS